MRAAVFHRPGEPLAIEDRQVPVARPGDLIIKVAFCGICGSDLHATEPSITQLESGTVLGHEFAGVVVQSEAAGFAVGDRVTGVPLQECDDCRPSGLGCRDRLGIVCPRNKIIGLGTTVPGGYAEFLRLPAHHALKVPDGLDLRLAALTEPLAVGAHAVKAAGNLFGRRVLVIGAGPIGLATALFAQVNGAREIVISEPAAGRRALAARLGLAAIDPAVTPPVGAEVIFECVGVPGLLRQCMDLAPVQGTVVVVGVCRGEDTILPRVGIRKELTVRFVLGYTQAEFAQVLDLMASGRLNAGPLITGVVGLDDLPAMFESLRTAGAHAKVLIDPTL
jgi:(R,R)-butanediol dehydrogenase / meso-butanediol dehydrogenase / diacetyl reductase